MSDEARLKIAKEIAERRRKSGVFKKPKKNKIKHWYSTRVLKEWVEDRLEMYGGPIRINGRHVMQIRGKHMRRLKKKMKIKQVGRYIIKGE